MRIILIKQNIVKKQAVVCGFCFMIYFILKVFYYFDNNSLLFLCKILQYFLAIKISFHILMAFCPKVSLKTA